MVKRRTSRYEVRTPIGRTVVPANNKREALIKGMDVINRNSGCWWKHPNYDIEITARKMVNWS